MGDDVLSHEIEFDVPEDMTVKDFFGFLEKERYLPSIQGNNVAWELHNRNGNKVFISLKQERLSIQMEY